MLFDTGFPRWFWNTIQVAAVSTIISVGVASFGAYALVRLRWRGAGFVQTAILFAYLMPTVMLFIPLYQIFTNLKLINTLGALMLAYPTFGLPFASSDSSRSGCSLARPVLAPRSPLSRCISDSRYAVYFTSTRRLTMACRQCPQPKSCRGVHTHVEQIPDQSGRPSSRFNPTQPRRWLDRTLPA
jgi:ABC-type sugar transport system permease subunit